MSAIAAAPGLLRLEAGKLHDVGPFLCFVNNELAELRWRARKRGDALVRDLRREIREAFRTYAERATREMST